MTPLAAAQKIDGSKSKSTISSLLDEFSRKCEAIRVQRKLNSTDAVGATTDLFTSRGLPASIHLRLRNGPEFVALRFQDWLKKVGQPLLIYPCSPWENGYDERFNGTFRREVLNAEWFHSKQSQVAINVWLGRYNQIRPHHALGMRSPAPETLLDKAKISGAEKWG